MLDKKSKASLASAKAKSAPKGSPKRGQSEDGGDTNQEEEAEESEAVEDELVEPGIADGASKQEPAGASEVGEALVPALEPADPSKLGEAALASLDANLEKGQISADRAAALQLHEELNAVEAGSSSSGPSSGSGLRRQKTVQSYQEVQAHKKAVAEELEQLKQQLRERTISRSISVLLLTPYTHAHVRA